MEYLIKKAGFISRRFSKKIKDRIRRKLQCFRGITVHRGCELWYNIMKLPNPKPRTIQRSLKIFNWLELEDILQKVTECFNQ